MSRQGLEGIQQQVMWNRLIAVVEEQAQALLRTAFGSVTREAGDLSAGVYDLGGRMLAQAVTGTPGHVNTMANAVGHFLERFLVAAMKPGDVFVSNDPWMGTGHLFDFVVVTPAFSGDVIVGLFASTCHVIDVGGRGFSAEARSVFEEGILVPHTILRRQGALNEELMEIICANTRNPLEVRGDILSLISSNDTGVVRLAEMMEEFDLSSLEALAGHILKRSEEATKEAISKVPEGTYKTQSTFDGYVAPITVKAAMSVSEDHISVDFAGTSPASTHGINSPECYSEAYTIFGLKCIVAPEVPNNAGSLSCFSIKVEDGSCVAPVRPSPVTARHVIGQMLPDVAFGCLEQALPNRVPAESAGSIWVLAMASAAQRAAAGANATSFNVMNVGLGGVGARPGKDGLDATAFPSGVGSIPVEITESQSPLVFRQKEYLSDSGGPGQYRGGLGQIIEVANTEAAPFTVSAATFDRIDNPPLGRAEGKPGQPGAVRLGSGPELRGKGIHLIPSGDSLIVELPGGGGLGDAGNRAKSDIRRDLEHGLISVETARRDYGYNDES